MAGHTSYQDEFVGHSIKPAELIKRKAQGPAGKFSNKTSYNTQYIGYEKDGNHQDDPYFDQFNTG